ncbi:hypothetical protein TIFTF001_017386 [Ficus carica]|uniref:Uncharacterized protein n=1 Tax=Ficus carica TaxID=3494 RepID=A0AA88A4Y1_FICCA|nr:hypothetical protein TIFTF001_017386 [Ficus carica]
MRSLNMVSLAQLCSVWSLTKEKHLGVTKAGAGGETMTGTVADTRRQCRVGLGHGRGSVTRASTLDPDGGMLRANSGIDSPTESTKFSQCNLPATTQEHFVSLEIPPKYPAQWQTQGFTHLNFGAIRLAPTFHGRKGLPVCARIALLDSRHRIYRDAVIATVQTTLNVGIVITMVFPNFCMSFQDSCLLNALKVQLQITGINMDPNSIFAALYYQMVYKVQNHALDLTLPGTTDPLMITADSQNIPMCTQIPKQISTEELKKLLSDSWITNYEKLHQSHVAIQSSEATFTTQKDGSTLITFNKPQEAPSSSSLFPTQHMMIPINPDQAKVESFLSNLMEKPQYANRSQTCHCYWDVCHCPGCTKDSYQDDSRVYPKKASSGRKLKQQLLDGHKKTIIQEDYHLHRLHQLFLQYSPVYKQAQKYLQKQGQQFLGPCSLVPMALPQVYMMSSISYDEDFLPLQVATTSDGTKTRQPKVLNPRTVEPDESAKKVSPAEAVMNWKSKNLIVQNKKLQKIDHKISQLSALKTQATTGFSMPSTVPWQFAIISKTKQSLPMVPPREDHVLRLKKLLDQDDALRKLKGKQKAQGSTSSQLMPSISSKEEGAPEDSDWSSDVSEPEESTSLQPIMMNQPADEPTVTEVPDLKEPRDEVNQPPRRQSQASTTASNGKPQTFTLDDILPSKWRDRFQEFKVFLVLQIHKLNA